MHSTTIDYIQKGPCFNDNVSIDILIHEGDSDEILLIIPGVDGTVNGYKDKYLKMAKSVNLKCGATTIQMSNPHNLCGYHLRNLFEVLDFIEENYDMTKKRLHVVAHSLGAYMISSIAFMYDYIDRILLINPATGLKMEDYDNLSKRNKDKNIFLIGEKDPSVMHIIFLKKFGVLNIQPSEDHHFSNSLQDFIDSPLKYIFTQ